MVSNGDLYIGKYSETLKLVIFLMVFLKIWNLNGLFLILAVRATSWERFPSFVFILFDGLMVSNGDLYIGKYSETLKLVINGSNGFLKI